jgi:hypothetical protein
VPSATMTLLRRTAYLVFVGIFFFGFDLLEFEFAAFLLCLSCF